MTLHLAFAGREEQTMHRQHSGASHQRHDHHRHGAVVEFVFCFDRFPTHPLSIVRSFHRKNVATMIAPWPTSFLELGTVGGAVRSPFRYCVDDDSFKKCHRSSALFSGSGQISWISASCRGKGSILPARIALPSLFAGLGICINGLVLSV